MTIKIIKSAINISMGGLIILPFSSTYQMSMFEEEMIKWGKYYVYNDLEVAVKILPLVLIWVLINLQIAKKTIKKLNIILVLISAFLFLNSTFLWGLAIQDIDPMVGNIIPLILFPLILIYFLKFEKLNSGS